MNNNYQKKEIVEFSKEELKKITAASDFTDQNGKPMYTLGQVKVMHKTVAKNTLWSMWRFV